MLFFYSAAQEEVQHVPAVGALGAVELGEAAAAAAHGDKALVLDVENFRQVPAGGLELVVIVVFIAALGAAVLSALNLRFHSSRHLQNSG